MTPDVRSPLPSPLRFGAFIRRFLHTETASGVIMLACAAVAMVAANSGLKDAYFALVNLPLSIGAGEGSLSLSLKLWVNDLLMAAFFLVVGLEIKRELLEGALARRDQRVLPLIGAVGGMAVPALIYVWLNWGDGEAIRGWAIPSATDIAFSLCVLALVGRGVPKSLTTFLLALAIIDDLGAVIIIACFYTAGLNLHALTGAGLLTIALIALNRARVCALAPYLLTGFALWCCVFASGIHATVAGVIVGLCVPLSCAPGRAGPSPLKQMIDRLHPWVGFLILPVFALVNAGVALEGISAEHLASPVPLGVALGLFLGKQAGVAGFCALAFALRLARMPEQASWPQFYGVALLTGIGFTMSLFIGQLAFLPHPLLEEEAKVGILLGSLLSAAAGFAVLRLTRYKGGHRHP